MNRTPQEQAAYDAGFRDGKIGRGGYFSGAATPHYLEGKKAGERARNRAERSQVLHDLGLTRVRGSRGGIYWE